MTLKEAKKWLKQKPCYTPDSANCDELHNDNGHHYGCECDGCMEFYRSLKR